MLDEYGSIGSNAIKDKATQIMDGMMLTYLTGKPNMREYMLAYVEEMDYLFEQVNEVFLGRFILNAEGNQLDIIGEILQQNRAVVLDKVYFGFVGATGSIAGMADENTPALGGIFRSENEQEGGAAPLLDAEYRRLLLTKAASMNASNVSVNRVYHLISLMLGFTPSFMELNTVSPRVVSLDLDISEVTPAQASLAQYSSKFYIPAGTSFTINLN
jgi:hypothetical protein